MKSTPHDPPLHGPLFHDTNQDVNIRFMLYIDISCDTLIYTIELVQVHLVIQPKLGIHV